jgi:hypothetical protein
MLVSSVRRSLTSGSPGAGTRVNAVVVERSDVNIPTSRRSEFQIGGFVGLRIVSRETLATNRGAFEARMIESDHAVPEAKARPGRGTNKLSPHSDPIRRWQPVTAESTLRVAWQSSYVALLAQPNQVADGGSARRAAVAVDAGPWKIERASSWELSGGRDFLRARNTRGAGARPITGMAAIPTAARSRLPTRRRTRTATTPSAMVRRPPSTADAKGAASTAERGLWPYDVGLI